MKIAVIAAIGSNFSIGKDNRLLWRLPEDMRFFKQTTQGHPVITGRKNYESIPEAFRPLPGRENIVITQNKAYSAPGAVVVHSLEEALLVARKSGSEEIFVIGGGKVYTETLSKKLADRMYITHVHGSFEADTFFPQWNPDEWRSQTVLTVEPDEKHAFGFHVVRYDKV
jgi:dihydrofolate reductase